MGLFNRKKKSESLPIDELLVQPETIAPVSQSIPNCADAGLTVLLDKLPDNYSIDDSQLVEITEPSILARIDNAVMSLGTGAIVARTAERAIQANANGPLYSVVLKNGGELKKAADGIGYRGFSMDKNHIVDSGLFFKETPDKVGALANIGASAMNVASMVVGQYYMSQVDSKLTALGETIASVVDYLDVQYKSEVASLIESVYGISKYQMSSLANEELRRQELDNIQLLRNKCQVLLNQAENSLEALISKDCEDYKNYVNTIKSIAKWQKYQSILVQLLYQLNTLDFTLHIGIKSKGQCFGSFPLHTSKLDKIHSSLLLWHQAQCETLKIDLTGSRRKKSGLYGLFEKPISLINDEWNYRPVKEDTVKLIQEQIAEVKPLQYEENNPFEDEVKIVIKNGKKYYLPK